MALRFDVQFDPRYGEAIPVAEGVRRLTAQNPGPFTFYGTNTYLVGHKALAVIDPGPDDDAHLHAILRSAGDTPITHIFVSHTHRDHSPLAARLKALTGATVLAEGIHRASRPLRVGEVNPLDASADVGFRPDVKLLDDMLVEHDDWAIRTIHTPGHTANHLAFSLEDRGITFSADHVMAWSTSIVAPPDGAMSDYMASLDKLIARQDRLLLPGHGGPVKEPLVFLRELRTHRKMREDAVLERLNEGDRTIREMVTAVYRTLDPQLYGAASLSLLAHLEDLVDRGLVAASEISLDGNYWPAVNSDA